MAIEDIKSDLQSLIKLYRHLQSLRIVSQSAGSEYLDEKAEIFLKDLLDGASERVFEAHSEFMAARLDVSKPLVSPHESKNSPEFSQKLICNSNTADYDENKTKPETLVFSSENSNPKPAKRKRRYKIHPIIHIERLKSIDAKKDIRGKESNFRCQQWNEFSPYKNLLNDTNNVNNAQNFGDSVSISGNEVSKLKSGHGTSREIERKKERDDSMSNQVASTIKIIDSHILALELAVDSIVTEQCVVINSELNHPQKLLSSKPVDQSVCDFKDINRVPKNDCIMQGILGNEGMDHNKMKLTEFKMQGDIEKLSENIGKENSTNLKNNFEENKVSGGSVKAMVQRIESMSRLVSQGDRTTNHGYRYVCGMRVPATPASPSEIDKKSNDLYSSPRNELNVGKSRSSMSIRTQHQYPMSPLLHGYGEDTTQGNKKLGENRKNILSHRENIETTSSSSVASSSWTKQQESNSSSYFEDYSENSDEYVGSTSYPDSQSESFSNIDIELSENDISNKISSGSESESFSDSYPMKGKRQTGRFNKLKNKLGLIFHHHHHHHHHHHDADANKATRGRSLWKNAGKILRNTGKKEKNGEKDVISLVGKAKNKNQNGHFHDLVKGVWKHVKNSRSSKVSKNDVERVGKSHRGRKNGAQKLRWWRMLQQQRTVKKMPRKPKVKIGVENNKPRLRPLPMLTSEDGEG